MTAAPKRIRNLSPGVCDLHPRRGGGFDPPYQAGLVIHLLMAFSSTALLLEYFIPNPLPTYHCCVLVSHGLGTLRDFQQSARVCRKQHFQPKISMFVNFPMGTSLVSDFQQSARVCSKLRFQPPRSAPFVNCALNVHFLSHF